MSEHTPGPWKWQPHWNWENRSAAKDKDLFLCGSDGSIILGPVEVEYLENIPNRDLIAAAPELLEALKALLEQFEKWEGYHQWVEEDEIAADQAKAAIAKAEAVETDNTQRKGYEIRVTNEKPKPDRCSCSVCKWSGKVSECNSYEESESWENPTVYTVHVCPKCEDGGEIVDYYYSEDITDNPKPESE